MTNETLESVSRLFRTATAGARHDQALTCPCEESCRGSGRLENKTRFQRSSEQKKESKDAREHWSGRCREQSARSDRSEEHTSELQSLMRISYAVFCLKKKKNNTRNKTHD